MPNPAATQQSNSAGRRDVFELLVGYIAILFVLWTPPPFQRPLYWLGAALLIGLSVRSRADRRTLGFTSRHLAPASLILLGVALLAAAASALAHHLGTLHIPPTPRAFLNRYWGYILWSFVQQFLLQDLFLLRLRRIFPARDTLAVVLAASLFAFAHVPSPILTTFTLIWGVAACAWFVRYGNLYPLAVSHAVLGICVASTLPGDVTHNMRVGLGFLTYHRHKGQPAPLQKPPAHAGLVHSYAPTPSR